MQKYWNKAERLNTHRTGLGHLNDRSFIALGHHYGERDVVRKRSRPYTEWQMNETPTQGMYCGAVCSNVNSYSIPRIRETDQAPGREGGFYPSAIFFFLLYRWKRPFSN